MPIVAAAPPQHLTTPGRFDYVTVDTVNRRVYAAHTGGAQLLIVDADRGKILGLITIGPMHGVAVNPDNGHIYAGIGGGINGGGDPNGGDETGAVSEIDPVTFKEVQRLTVEGPVDAIAYDPQLHQIYADEDNGTRIFVIDSKTFKEIGSIALPGKKPEYIQVDPKTHQIYQNLADMNEIAVIDPHTLTMWRTIPTPEIQDNHALQFDAPFNQLWAVGENNQLSIYSDAGKLVQTMAFPTRVDQCSLDPTRQLFACAGDGLLTLVQYDGKHTPSIIGQAYVPASVHTLAIDPKTGWIWIVWGDAKGAFVQPFVYRI
jgi:hypothetical protein